MTHRCGTRRGGSASEHQHSSSGSRPGSSRCTHRSGWQALADWHCCSGATGQVHSQPTGRQHLPAQHLQGQPPQQASKASQAIPGSQSSKHLWGRGLRPPCWLPPSQQCGWAWQAAAAHMSQRQGRPLLRRWQLGRLALLGWEGWCWWSLRCCHRLREAGNQRRWCCETRAGCRRRRRAAQRVPPPAPAAHGRSRAAGTVHLLMSYLHQHGHTVNGCNAHWGRRRYRRVGLAHGVACRS